MADNPFGGLSEGVGQGVQLGLLFRQRKVEQAKMQIQMQQAKEAQDMNVVSQAIGAINSDSSGPTTKQNAKLILNSYFKKYAGQLGVDPASINIDFDHENADTKDAMKLIDKNIKGLTEGSIHPEDFAINVKDALGVIGQAGNKAVTESVTKAAQNAWELGTKTPEPHEVEINGKKILIQPSSPGSRSFVPTQVGGTPAIQPIAAPATDTGPLNSIAASQKLLNDISDSYNSKFVGPFASRIHGTGQNMGLIGDPESTFRAKVAQHQQAAKALLASNPDAAKNAPVMPETTMNSKEFEATVKANKDYYRDLAKHHISTLVANGYNVPQDVAASALNMPTAAPDRPPLDSFVTSASPTPKGE